jgi:dCMP deaminase
MEEKEIRMHNKFLNIAEEIAKDSKCVQLSVGAILVKNGRIISTGYNGTPAGFLNCNDYFSEISYTRNDHHNFSENYEIHAELNAIIYAALNGISIAGCDIYITHHPCANCLKMLCAAGIKKIYYRYSYDKANITQLTQKMLDDLKIELINVKN